MVTIVKKGIILYVMGAGCVTDGDGGVGDDDDNDDKCSAGSFPFAISHNRIML